MTTGKRPLSSHPAFTPIVGLWFAALLGGGLLVMPYAIHDALAARSGLATLVPAGLATRMAIAGVGALVGLLLGFAIAGRVSAANAALAEEDDDDDWPMPMEAQAGEEPGDDGWLADPLDEALPAHGIPDDIPGEPRGHRPLFNPREETGEGGIAAPAAIEDAEFEEWVEADSALAPEEAFPAAMAEPVPHAPADTDREPLGNLSLDALTERLARALAASRAQQPPSYPADTGQGDPVISFLRRESERPLPEQGNGDAHDPQAILRSALDKLTQAQKPR